MDKSLYLSIVWSSLIICKFQVYTCLLYTSDAADEL